jgi:hypothetical protein
VRKGLKTMDISRWRLSIITSSEGSRG